MRRTIRFGIVTGLAAFAFTAAATAPALAATSSDPGGVEISGEPDTSNLHDVWTDATVLGVPVIGLVQSVAEAPGKLLPSSD